LKDKNSFFQSTLNFLSTIRKKKKATCYY